MMFCMEPTTASSATTNMTAATTFISRMTRPPGFLTCVDRGQGEDSSARLFVQSGRPIREGRVQRLQQ